VTGEAEFRGLSLVCDARALVPRPETEGVVDAILQLDLPRQARIADLGTGSGCIAVALAVERPDVQVEALDRSPEALALARENARRHGVADRIRLHEGDLGAPPDDWRGSMDLVVGAKSTIITMEPSSEIARESNRSRR